MAKRVNQFFISRKVKNYCTYCMSNHLGEGEAWGPGDTFNVVEDDKCDAPAHDED